MIVDKDRGTGRTTRQLNEMKEGGVYVIHHHSFESYCKNILKGTKKLRFMTNQQVGRGDWMGLDVPCVDMDHHAVEMCTKEQWWEYLKFKDYVKVHSS